MTSVGAPTNGVTTQSAGAGRGVALTLLVALLAALVGAGAVWAWQRAPQEGNPAVLFARDMSAHHTQAVEMALIIRDRIADENLRLFTLDIALTQQAQIGQMQGWLTTWRLPLSSTRAPMDGMGEMMGMATAEQVAALRTLPVAEAETLFLQLMIRHHQGGVLMAQDTLRQTSRPEVTRLANAIVQGQESEIGYMHEQLVKRGAQPLPDVQPMQHHTP